MRAVLGVSVVYGSEYPHAQHTAEATDDDVEAVDEVQRVDQAEQQCRDCSGGEDVGDEEDAEDTRALQRDDDGRDDDDNSDCANPEKREFVAEHVV